jgi:vacuolar-type H+-ATPase subunit D/Vma8
MKIFLKCGIKFIEVILDLAQLAEVGTYKNIKSVKHIFGNPV